jgi:hypothetical protein
VHVRFEDEGLRAAVDALAVSADQPRQAVAEMHYAIEGDGPYAVLEEGDRLSAGLSASDAVEVVSTRCRARVLDHLDVSGWTGARAGVARVEGRSVLVLGDAGDDLVFFRAGMAVNLPTPSSTEVVEASVTAVAVVEAADEPRAPLDTGQVVEALVAATLPSWKPPGDILRACVELVRGADGYRVATPPPRR